jgi:DNA-binding transcriptional MerR regulator
VLLFQTEFSNFKTKSKRVPYKEKEIEKKYYTIGEVADDLGVATSLIRFWESEFDIIRPKKNRKGNRQFTKTDIKNVKLIYHLVKEKGYTLQGARDFIKNGIDEATNKIELIESLKKVKGFLVQLRDDLPS